MSDNRYYVKESESNETINKGVININTSSNIKAIPDVISPIYQKVLGCQFMSAKSNGVLSHTLDMTDPTAVLKSLLRAERSLNNTSVISPRNTSVMLPQSKSMTLPTCVSMTVPVSESTTVPTCVSMTGPVSESMTLPTSVSMILPTCVSLSVSESRTFIASKSMTLSSSESITLPTSESITLLKSESITVPTYNSITHLTSNSMTHPTSESITLATSNSMTFPTYNSKTFLLPTSSKVTMNESSIINTSSDSQVYGGLDSEQMYPVNDDSSFREEHLTVSEKQKQEQYKSFRSKSSEFSDKDSGSMSRLQTSSESPGSDSRLSEGDQTVPRSVLPPTQSPSLQLGDECRAFVQSTTVPPPEVLTQPSAGSLNSFNGDEVHQMDASETGIQSLDNYEYFIHRVDQNSLETQSKEKCPGVTQSPSSLYDSVIYGVGNGSSILNTKTENAQKNSVCQTDENKSDVVARIQIDSDDECYIIENNIPKSARLAYDNIPLNLHPDNNEQIEDHCVSTEKDRISVTITSDNEKLDEELSEMRKYYLEDYKEQGSDKQFIQNQKGVIHDSTATSTLCRRELQTVRHRELQGLLALGNTNDVHIHHVESAISDVTSMSEQFSKQEGPLTASNGHCFDLISSRPQSDLRMKEVSEKRYYLKDGLQESSTEPGEIVHCISSSASVSSNAVCFNGPCGNYIPTQLEHDSQIRNCVTQVELTLENCRQSTAMTKTLNPHFSTERQFDCFNKNLKELHNAESFLSDDEEFNNVCENKTTSQYYSSVLFPVSIRSSSSLEMGNLNRSMEKGRLKSKLQEDINHTCVDPPCSSSAIQSDSIRVTCTNPKRIQTKNDTNSTDEKVQNSVQSYLKTLNHDYTVKPKKINRPLKRTTYHLNGIIEKLWVSKTCVIDQLANALSSSDTHVGAGVSKSDYVEAPVSMSSTSTNENSKKSKKTSVKLFECSTCGFQDKQYSGIEKHVVKTHRPNGCTCDTCGQTLDNHCHCQGRFKIRSKVAAFECSICKKHCRTISGLRQHKAKKHGHWCLSAYQPPYTCKLCNKDQLEYSRFKEHMLTHGVARPFTCKACSKSFHSKSGLALHFSKLHQL